MSASSSPTSGPPERPTPAGGRRGGRSRRRRRSPGGNGSTAHTRHPVPPELDEALAHVSLVDEDRFRRRLAGGLHGERLDAITREIDDAARRTRRRADSVGTVRFPEDLPVSARRDEIADAIRDHQVVIVAGETGSGKTTQLPKICLELGRGVRGMIGHTQPRRIAARAVAERIADELDTEVGGRVGYAVRFTDEVSDDTMVKLMTDGILLAEIQRDRLLRRYDTIIVDEAHERSLNIDFLLGYLREILPRRPDLKVVITSATIDPERFARHFAEPDGSPAPVIEVSGRTYPVEVRYRPLTVDRGDEIVERDQVDGVCDAVAELLAERTTGPGDILVFLSGEREIRDTADALRDRRFRDLEILPLYGRLSAAEQHRVFTPHTGRRVVLSTNVAETSLTVPGIGFVVDPGTARISRYSVRTKVQRLPIEEISQASARQRAGRCGRVADGVCIRLYSEEDFEARPEFTEPEILRTNLASVILQMTALGLGEVEKFGFVEPPDPRAVRDGMALLTELGALSAASGKDVRLTDTGRELARLPVDPRMARMLVEANREGCLREMLVVVAALSIQDVRERPTEHRQAADARHARFDVSGSDFVAYLTLWNYLREQRAELSGNRFRRLCRDEFLHWLRIREWQDLHGQLRSITRSLGWDPGPSDRREPVDDTRVDPVHRSILSGLLSNVGVREGDKREFTGARGTKFAIFPGSALFSKPPRWVMAAELVETSRLWARTTARIEPEWVEKLAPHLVKRSYSEPYWSTKREAAMAYERVTLYGLPVVPRRPVLFGRIDPVAARDLFIRHALVHGEWRTHHAFFAHNRALLDDVESLEDRARRRDIVVDDDVLFDFYDRRVGQDVTSTATFDRWWKSARATDPDLLTFTPETVVTEAAAGVVEGDYPTAWRQGDLTFDLSYQFEPGTEDDGVTVRIPVALLASVRPVGFDWSVPGLRAELVTALIKTLPKALRRRVVPAPDFAAAALAAVRPRTEPLTTALARELSRLGSAPIEPRDFDVTSLPAHLRMHFAAVDSDGSVLARDTSLTSLRDRLAGRVRTEVARVATGAERPAATSWTTQTLGEIAPTVVRTVDGQQVTGYPALVAEPEGVAVRVLSTAADQAVATRAGLRSLLLRAVPTSARSMLAGVSNTERLALGRNPDGDLDALLEDCRSAAADEMIAPRADAIRTPEAFDELVATARRDLPGRVASLLRAIVPVMARKHELDIALDHAQSAGGGMRDAADDVRDQVASLLFPGFVADTGRTHLVDLPRYLHAATVRLEAFPGSADRDARGMDVLDRVYGDYQRLLDRVPPARRTAPDIVDIAWQIEELRVSLFAQALGTRGSVSEKRIRNAIASVR